MDRFVVKSPTEVSENKKVWKCFIQPMRSHDFEFAFDKLQRISISQPLIRWKTLMTMLWLCVRKGALSQWTEFKVYSIQVGNDGFDVEIPLSSKSDDSVEIIEEKPKDNRTTSASESISPAMSPLSTRLVLDLRSIHREKCDWNWSGGNLKAEFQSWWEWELRRARCKETSPSFLFKLWNSSDRRKWDIDSEQWEKQKRSAERTEREEERRKSTD